jgi:hypothetical protein
MTARELKTMCDSLRVWSRSFDFTDADWQNYIRIAQIVQQTDPQIVETALDLFVKAAVRESFRGYTSESKPFLLMRVIFDLPEAAPAEERWLYKGWTNWPQPDAQGKVNLAWPISWRSGWPKLLACYEGSEGHPYAAVAEYRHLRAAYPFRALSILQGERPIW